MSALLVSPKTIVFGITYVLLWFYLFFFLFFYFRRVISELRWPIRAKFCTMLDAAFSFIIPVQNFGRAFQRIFRGQKHAQFCPDFNRFRSLAANIFGTNKNIQNRWVTRLTAIPPPLNETGKNRSSNLKDLNVSLYPPKAQYSEDRILAPRGCCAPNFYTR